MEKISTQQQMSFTCSFKAHEIDQLFIHGFAMVYPMLKDERLLEKFQKADKVVRNSIEEVEKILTSDDETYEFTMYVCKTPPSVRFDLKIQCFSVRIPVEFGNNRTKNLCRDIAICIKGMREEGHLPEPGKEPQVLHHSP